MQNSLSVLSYHRGINAGFAFLLTVRLRLAQSFMLVVKEYSATVKKSVDLYRHVLLTPQIANRLIGETNVQLQNYWKVLLTCACTCL